MAANVTGARQPHRPRFMVVYGLLGAVLVVAIAGVVVYAGRSINPAPTWSSWKPSGGGLGAAKQIADQVGTSYRLPNGDQLVSVIAKAPSVSPSSGATIPLHYIAIQGTKGVAGKDYAISPTNSVTYDLCGLGSNCSIATGKPSVARGTLVRREILELAMYTFKYVGGIDNVIAFMPPAAGSTTQYVIYLQKSDLKDELKQPLDKTLQSKVPLPAAIPAREVHTVDSVTEPRVYTYGVAQAQTGDFVLVLTPTAA
ncbi:MAG: hypothetical protein JOY73_01290 [Actinobacteria bacterium]|nr:hypothetical protein [Actinomycetota bacterium]